jgi:hypothetical protein
MEKKSAPSGPFPKFGVLVDIDPNYDTDLASALSQHINRYKARLKKT